MAVRRQLDSWYAYNDIQRARWQTVAFNMFGTAVPTYLTDEQFDAVDREFTRQETKIEVVE